MLCFEIQSFEVLGFSNEIRLKTINIRKTIENTTALDGSPGKQMKWNNEGGACFVDIVCDEILVPKCLWLSSLSSSQLTDKLNWI